MNLSYKPERLTVNKIIIDFILELIKIPLKLIFELTSNNKWYYESHLYKFNCDVKVNTDNLNEFKLQIINPTLKNNNQNIQSARSKRINAHGTPPFPFHFPF